MNAPLCAVVGCGPMGIAAADNLLEEVRAGDLRLLLVDRDAECAANAQKRYTGVDAVTVVCGDTRDRHMLQTIGGADVLAAALSWVDAEPVIVYCLARGMPATTIGQPPGDPCDLLGEDARTGLALLPVGLEPGLAEILATDLVSRHEDQSEVSVLCGGVPQQPRPPLGHSTFFGRRLTAKPDIAHAVRKGRIVTLERFTGLELVEVPGVGVLEAYHDALQPWPLDGPLLSKVSEMTQKTLRRPGYARKMRFLADIGMLREEPIQVNGIRAVPRDVLEAALSLRTGPRPEDRDVTVLVVESTRRGGSGPAQESVTVIARKGEPCSLSGMAVLTGGVLAESVRVLLWGSPSASRGVLRPPEVFTGPALRSLLDRLKRLGATVAETKGPAVRRLGPLPPDDDRGAAGARSSAPEEES